MKKAFTLIELLVVVLIIGILSAIALPQYKKAVDDAEFARANMVARYLVRQLEYYHLQTGEYPTDLRNLEFDVPGCTVVESSITCDIKNSGEKLLFVLSSNKNFIYFIPGGGFLRNEYYPLYKESEHPGEWYCCPLGRISPGGRICKKICGSSTCYYH